MIKKFNKRNIKIIIGVIIITLVCLCMFFSTEEKTVTTSGNELSTKKIEWGIKRASDHNQPDLGSTNKRIIDELGGIAMGNKDSKKVYLTFDEGYEAGYTPKILEVLKQNSVKACFFVTAHFVNSHPELVQQMIDEGHIVGNQSPHSLMDIYKSQ